MFMRYQWIIFDADGTLFDYDQAEYSALRKSFRFFDLEYRSEYLDIYRGCNKKLWEAFELGNITIEKLKIKRFELFLKQIGAVVDSEAFSHEYLNQLSACSYLIDGAEKLITFLSGKVGLILMTNGIKEVQRSRFGRSSIHTLFSDIIISDEVGVAKPDKRIFEIAFENMSILDKSTVLMVGDNLSSDIKGGINFGIDTCWYNPNHFEQDPEIRATYELKNLQDLRIIIEN